METLQSIEGELLSYETKIENIIETLGDTESPDIVCGNLSLISALLSDSRSHLNNKVKQLKIISKINYADISKKKAVVCLERIRLSKVKAEDGIKFEVAAKNENEDHLMNEMVDNDINVNLVKMESTDSKFDPLKTEGTYFGKFPNILKNIKLIECKPVYLKVSLL